MMTRTPAPRARARLRSLAAVSLSVSALFLLAACAPSAAQEDGATQSENDYTGADATQEQTEALVKSAGIVDDTSWCGEDPITVGVADAFGVNGWSQSSYAAVRSELAKCDNVTQLVTVGQGDLSKAISDVNGLVSQGVDAIVSIPSLGQGQLPSLQAATSAGVDVVVWGADPGGEPGTDYLALVDWDPEKAGERWATWVAEKLDGTGKVVYLGGPAGNPVSVGTLKGIGAVFADYPDIELLTGSDTFPATNWDPAQAQNIMASLIAKNPQIDAVITDDGSSGQGALRAFASSGRALPVMATLESNALGCAYAEATASNPSLEVATISARNWLGRIAARKAVAAASGLPQDDPTQFDLPLFEDSSAGNPPKCDPSVSPETFFSNELSPDDIATYGKAS